MDGFVKIGLTIGDVNGIGLEVILKSLHYHNLLDKCIPIIYGSTKVVSYHKNILDDFSLDYTSVSDASQARPNKLNVINVWNKPYNITLGIANEVGGDLAMQSLEAATKDLKDKQIDALVTAPIHKQAMKMAGFEHVGHTEYLTNADGRKDALMVLVSDHLKVALVTTHIPIAEVASKITKELVSKKIKQFEKSLMQDFGLDKPTIAVLGLNPHAGDDGLIGEEDNDQVRPAIIEAKKSGSLVMGPFPADGFFGSGQFSKFDGILAMYHDQGLVPFKTLSFGEGVNVTAGLSFVRTSPDHGTAIDKAGKNEANFNSMAAAIFRAIDIVRKRSWSKDKPSD